jgi:hypothetical protein
MKLRLNIGGELETGDVVGIAYNNYIAFGWFVEPGGSGSLKYMSFTHVVSVKKYYDDYTAGKAIGAYTAKRFAKGLSYKSLSKDYVITFGGTGNRAFKIANPEEFFKDAGITETNYRVGREVLNSIKFPAK